MPHLPHSLYLAVTALPATLSFAQVCSLSQLFPLSLTPSFSSPLLLLLSALLSLSLSPFFCLPAQALYKTNQPQMRQVTSDALYFNVISLFLVVFCLFQSFICIPYCACCCYYRCCCLVTVIFHMNC